MLMFEYHVVLLQGDQPPEDHGIEMLDHHPVPGKVIQLHWLDGREAGKASVSNVDPSSLRLYVQEIDGTATSAPMAPEERLRDVGRLVTAARDRLQVEVGEQGLVVAVVVRTFDGASIHVGLGSPVLIGSDLGPRDLVELLHSTVDDFLAKLPSVVPLTEGEPS